MFLFNSSLKRVETAITLAVFAFNLSGDSPRDVLDPKLRAALTATGMRTERVGLFDSCLQEQ